MRIADKIFAQLEIDLTYFGWCGERLCDLLDTDPANGAIRDANDKVREAYNALDALLA